MSASSSRRPVHVWTSLLPSLVAGGLWLLVAGVRQAFLQISSGVAQVGTLVPAIVPSAVWQSPDAWPAVTVVLGVLAVVACHALYLSLVSRGGASSLVGAWFAAIAAGATVGLALDVAVVWDSLTMFGARGLLVGEFAATAAAGALWGLVTGWMPGLVAARTSAAPATEGRRPTFILAAAGVVLVALIAGGIAGASARESAIAAEVEARRQAEAQTTFGALPDPNAPGEPVPTAAPSSGPLEPGWCTPDKATLLKGEPDAATGHRGMPVYLMNFSEEPCVIEGYPDLAFGDQNAHLLDVTVEQGGSFMAQDSGPQRIEVPAGGYAVTFLGWDAASPHGALVTKTVYAAPTAGMERGSWPIDLDIVAGSTVAVTAWALDPTLGGTTR